MFRTLPLLVALVLFAAACGQKSADEAAPMKVGALMSAPEKFVGKKVTLTGTVGGTTGGSGAPSAGTPAADLFSAINSWDASAIYFNYNDTVNIALTFTNLNPSKKYSIRGTAVRASNYTTRWSKVSLTGATSSTEAHQTGPGSPGIITSADPTYGGTLLPDGRIASLDQERTTEARRQPTRGAGTTRPIPGATCRIGGTAPDLRRRDRA